MDNEHNRLREIRRRIDNACRRANRNPREVTLIGAAKTVSASHLQPYLNAGLRDVGENYVQEGLAKQKELALLQGESDVPRWHLIGALQSNKARAVAGAFSLIHSVDRVLLAQALNRAASERQIVQAVLLQVNLGNEITKSGCAPHELEHLAQACAALPNLAVRGLMALPPWSENPEDSRPYFRHLRELSRHMSTHAEGEDLHLSMGMSRDFEIAIEEGATSIRVGTELFGSRPAT